MIGSPRICVRRRGSVYSPPPLPTYTTVRPHVAAPIRRALFAFALTCAISVGAAFADGDRPAILVAAPQGTRAGWVDLAYLEELHHAGFEVDYTDSLAELTWDRIKQYNVLVLYTCPPGSGQQAYPFGATTPTPAKADFIALIERYLGEGGGVLLMAVETNVGVTLVRDMIKTWGADLPLETIADPDNTAFMSRMPKVPLAYTSAVASSPVSAGVRGIWYPIQPHYNGADTLPLSVNDKWQVVVRAMSSAHTVPVDLALSSRPGPPDPLVRRGGVAAPPLYAIRPYRKGRIALLSQWPIYSIGSGTKWLYNREVLSEGLHSRPSDFARLLENSFRWLGAPSLESGRLGGYVTEADRLQPPNQTPEVRQQFEESPWTARSQRQRPSEPRLFKGLIGAQTRYSGGDGTVAEYAAAAKQAGLDFVVFLEDFANLDQETLARLKNDCKRHSDDALTLYPGYRIDTNIGNHMFLFGSGVTLPPRRLLTGPNNTRFMLQGETAPGVFGKTPPAAMEFLFRLTSNTQIGYYDFAHSGMGMRLPDARLYAMVALRTYRDGQLIEDVTDDYLTAVQATIAAAPAAVHLVDSPAALRTAATANNGLTYAAARSLARLWTDALLYTNQYTCPNVFTSTGPLIQRWPACERVATYGAETFVTGRSRREAPLHVTADRGLREVRIYDGERLFRRFLLHGEKSFTRVLYLDATVQRNLVLVAEDTAGGRAVSFPRRSWKDGSLAPVFCSDRINDCVYMFLARGPYPMTVLRTPELSDPGFTWDGGPRGVLTPIDFEGSAPRVDSNRGVIDGNRYNQTPLLQIADEGAVSVRSVRDELIDPRVPAVNPWNTYGPRAPAPLFNFSLSYTQFDRASVGTRPVGWAAMPSQTGCTAAVFRGAISFTQPLTVRSLRLLHNWNWIQSMNLRLVVGRRHRLLAEVDIGAIRNGTAAAEKVRLGRGDWFGFYAPEAGNSQLFINRGRPLELRIESRQDGNWLSLWALGVSDVTKDAVYRYELFGTACPLDAALHDGAAFAETVRYLGQPDGLRIQRGRRVKSPGVVEIRARKERAVRLSVARPEGPTQLTLPIVVDDLNPRWSAGLWQLSGYVTGDYGSGVDRYRAVAVTADGHAYVPLYPALVDDTAVEIGHAIVADFRGSQLFIEVTALSGGTHVNPDYVWYVDVNNPTDDRITTVLTPNIDLPGFTFTEREITLEPGEHRVVYASDPSTQTP